MLNALLDESSVLPTSGSRGCTAAAVQLVYNSSLVQEKPQDTPQEEKEVPVYLGEVEFMKKEDWENELRLLVQECCTDKGRLYRAKPNEKSMPAAASAWIKINQGEFTA